MTHFGRSVQRGFTLLEVLVVVSLLSVVMLALGSAFRTVAQAEERIDLRLARTDEVRTAVGFMRSAFGRASGRKVLRPESGKTGVMFAGASGSVAWIGVMPARYGAGGRCFFHLAMELDGTRPALVLRFTPWVDMAVFPDWSRAESRVLVRDVKGVTMRYMDLQADPPWSTEWAATDHLPDQLQLEVETEAVSWPPLKLPIRLMPTSDPTSGGAAFGAS